MHKPKEDTSTYYFYFWWIKLIGSIYDMNVTICTYNNSYVTQIRQKQKVKNNNSKLISQFTYTVTCQIIKSVYFNHISF